MNADEESIRHARHRRVRIENCPGATAAPPGGALGNVIDGSASELADILVVGGAGLLIVASVLPQRRSAADGSPPTLPPRPERREAARP